MGVLFGEVGVDAERSDAAKTAWAGAASGEERGQNGDWYW